MTNSYINDNKYFCLQNYIKVIKKKFLEKSLYLSIKIFAHLFIIKIVIKFDVASNSLKIYHTNKNVVR